MTLSSRTAFGAIALLCAALIGGALYLQHVQNLEPCPLCIVQRYAFILAGATALVAVLHNPHGVGQRIYGSLVAVFAAAGAAVAIRHVWLIHHPEQAMGCGPGFDYMVEHFPLSKSLPMIFRGTADCAAETWRLLGLTLPAWALVWFALIVFAGIFVAARNRPT